MTEKEKEEIIYLEEWKKIGEGNRGKHQREGKFARVNSWAGS